MSKREESLNDEAIFLCLVRGCVVSACQEETDCVQQLHTQNKTEDEVRTATYLIDLIGQLGQDGDPYDAVFNAIL